MSEKPGMTHNDLQVVLHSSLRAAQELYLARYGVERDKAWSVAMHNILIITEQCRQALSRPVEEITPHDR